MTESPDSSTLAATTPSPPFQWGVIASLLVALLASYSFARPAADSIFLDRYGAKALPWAWLSVALATALVATAYNRYLGGIDLTGRLVRTSLISAAALAGTWLALYLRMPGAAFALYVVKDVYIVVVLEVFWSLANATHDGGQARRRYGLFMLFGTLGSLLGNQLVGPVALAFGSSSAILCAAGALLLTAMIGAFVPSPPVEGSTGAASPRGQWTEGLRIVFRSRYLLAMVAVVAGAQLVTNLVDYIYSAQLAIAYPDTDARTAISGQIYSVIDVASLALQLVAPWVVGALGVTGTLLAIPSVAIASLVGVAVFMGFPAAALAKVAGKALDYSLFRVGKEMLYLPLDYREKTAGKAVVDMMTYRAAKAGASALLSIFVPLGLAGASALGWLAATVWVIRQYRRASPTDSDKS